MKVNELYTRVLVLCSQYGRAGINQSAAAEDFTARIPYLADIGQRELVAQGAAEPESITSSDDELAISGGDAAEALCYYIAGMLLLDTDSDKADFYLQKFEERRKSIMARGAVSETQIEDIYGTSCRVG